MSTLPEVINPGQASDAPPLHPLAVPQVNTAAAMTRAQAEVQAEYLMAMRMPRDEAQAASLIVSACKREGFAAAAQYKFPRGGSEVKGPSIKFAREAARIWGRIRTGYRVLERTEEEVLVEGFAVDAQTISIVTAQSRIKNKIQRKQRGGKTEWVEPDERDYNEMVGRAASKLIRNCILALLPADVVEDAMEQADKTNIAVASGQLGKDRHSTIRGILAAFADYGVMRPQIEAKIGNPLDAATPEQIASLRGFFRAISAGEIGAAEVFDLAPPATAAESKTAASVEAAKAKIEALKKGKGASPAEPTAADPATPTAEPEPAKEGNA